MLDVRPRLLVALLLTACAPDRLTHTWRASQVADDPRLGMIVEVATKRTLSWPALESRLRDADVVLLGEHHDHPDHHLLQAKLLRALVDAGERPAVVFEMLDAARQSAIDDALATRPTPDAFASAVDWAHSGWPAFELYRPLFDVALGAGLPVFGGDLDGNEARAIVRGGAEALPEDLRLLADVPLDPALASEWTEEMRVSHCGHLPVSLLAPMVLAQRARDLRLANRIVAASQGRGAVLIAGSGHVRRDRAVPAWLARLSPTSKVLSLSFEELAPSEPLPDALPFDLVVVTPPLPREDPCAAFRK